MEFDWDAFNTEHIAQHGVTTEEAESALLGSTMYLETRERNGEERISRVGCAHTGRILYLITTARRERVRVVTAFIAGKPLRKRYAVRFGECYDQTRNA